MRRFAPWSRMEQQLRSGRPKPPACLVRDISSQIRASEPAASPRGRLRVAAVGAAAVLGLLAVGGLGYAASFVPHLIVVVKHTFVSEKSSVHVAPSSAARAQYGTTATTTTTESATTTTTAAETTTTTTTTATTTTISSDGSATTSASSGSSGSVTTSAPGSSETVGVSWSATTFAAPVTITVDPTPPLASGFTIQGTNNALVSITVVDKSTGQAVTALAAPLEIVIANPAAGYVPAVSTDGVNFRALSELAGNTLPADQQDGYFKAADGIHVLTRHLTIFGVVSKANLTISETGRKLAPANSGKWGDAALVHVGPPVVRIAVAPIAAGATVRFKVFVDEQVALYLHVVSKGKQIVLQRASIDGRRVGGGGTTVHAVILRPGTRAVSIVVPGGFASAGLGVQFTAVDFDGHKVSQAATAGR